MGNAGSANNSPNDCIQSELNMRSNQRQTTSETKHKGQDVVDVWSSSRNVADCKVLPKSRENLKLRATTNGAILQAGGTISFRSKEPTKHTNEPFSCHPMRRCHTLILDSQNDTLSKLKLAPAHTEFRRSQTLLYVGYNKRKSPENISTNFNYTPQSPPQNIPLSSTLKVNKYNKKRKAPPAPIKNVCKGDVTSSTQNILLNDSNNPTFLKQRIYAPNNTRSQITQKQFQSPTMKVTPFQRDSCLRTSANNTSRQSQHINSSYASKLPYRRENSFDAKLLRRRNSNDCNTRSDSAQTVGENFTSLQVNELEYHLDCIVHDDNGQKKPIRQKVDATANEGAANFNKTGHLKDRSKVEDKFRLNIIPKNSKDSTSTNERKINELPRSRIPQLKRTFYFGMDSVNKPPNLSSTLPTPKVSAKMNDNVLKEKEDSVMLNHKIDAEEEIIDNGILVHVRPTLPRRQLETPSFSPAAAWRNLLEEQQRLPLERFKLKKNSSEEPTIDVPICLKSDAKENYPCTEVNWTPQQDLDDDDDEEGKEIKKTEHFSNSLHTFSLSLPRDVHLQCTAKNSTKYVEQENDLKPANCWLVPGFNSLQKLKTQLGNPAALRSSSKCTCSLSAANPLHSFQLENTFGESLAVDFKGYHQPHCEHNKTSSKPTCCQNNNWLLHKSTSKDIPLNDSSKNVDTSLKPPSNSLSSINFQPKSLSNICSGKHIVYLPGKDALNSSIKDSFKNSKQNYTNKSNYKRHRQRQADIRESLQDLTPIQNIHQSNVNVTEKNTHRFSFQSTVRVLEKRRLAEKLSKDAEVQEAQRLNELEVMKRVEEDFQRKRAPEKANLRKQLRMHLKANNENTEYRSLPLNITEIFNSQNIDNQHISDDNNNIFCRAEPDGAVSPAAEINDNLHKLRHSSILLSSTRKTLKNLDCFPYDGEGSESETQPPDLQSTARLIEPYLSSII